MYSIYVLFHLTIAEACVIARAGAVSRWGSHQNDAAPAIQHELLLMLISAPVIVSVDNRILITGTS
jgi:hypothetical protein